MTYVVDEKCIKCKHMDCVDVCPVEAILSDTEDGIEKWAELNRKYSEIWPNISEKKNPPKDAEKWQNISNKFKNHFSEKPGR